MGKQALGVTKRFYLALKGAKRKELLCLFNLEMGSLKFVSNFGFSAGAKPYQGMGDGW